MIDIKEHTIDGAMFLRNCSREEAVAWLTESISDEEIERFRTSRSFEADIVLKLELDTEQIRRMIMYRRIWDADFARQRDGLRRSQIITAEDLSIRIGPC